MAFSSEPIKTPDGGTIDSPVWMPVQINIGRKDGEGLIVFALFRSRGAFETGKEPISGQTKSYVLDKDEAIAAYARLDGLPYEIAKSRTDTPVLDANGNTVMEEVEVEVGGEMVKTERPQMRSFFDGAQKV